MGCGVVICERWHTRSAQGPVALTTDVARTEIVRPSTRRMANEIGLSVTVWLRARKPTKSGPATAARAAAPEDEREAAGCLECEWQRAKLPDEIRELVLDDQRLRNALCWFAFDC